MVTEAVAAEPRARTGRAEVAAAPAGSGAMRTALPGRVGQPAAGVAQAGVPDAAGKRAAGVVAHGGPVPATAAWSPDVDQWCDALVSLLVGGIGILSLALFGALGTFHG